MVDRWPRFTAWIRSDFADQLERAGLPGVRLSVPIGLGLVSIAGSVVLVAADAVGGGIRWSHHAGASAAPLLLVAAAIVTVTVAHPVKGRRALMRFVAVLAFTAWGLAQLLPDSGAAGALNDLAILLFIVDAGYAVISDATTFRPSTRRDAPSTCAVAPGHAEPVQPGQQLAAAGRATGPCCARPGDICGCGERRALPA
jgi:hypothetical protein